MPNHQNSWDFIHHIHARLSNAGSIQEFADLELSAQFTHMQDNGAQLPTYGSFGSPLDCPSGPQTTPSEPQHRAFTLLTPQAMLDFREADTNLGLSQRADLEALYEERAREAAAWRASREASEEARGTTGTQDFSFFEQDSPRSPPPSSAWRFEDLQTPPRYTPDEYRHFAASLASITSPTAPSS